MRPFLKPLFYSLKLFIESPKNFKEEFVQDFTKDYFINKNKYKNKFIWCAGLPKSGTTLIENIFDQLPYVRINSSPIRFYDSDKNNRLHEHDLTKNMIKYINYKKLSFLKTHTPFSNDLLSIIDQEKTKILVVIRDLRSMLLSRYFHILNQEDHWQHQNIIKLNHHDGFISSIEQPLYENQGRNNALEYYHNWILSWMMQDKFKILMLRFEDYSIKPIEYISNILKFCDIDWTAISIENNLKNKRDSQNKDLKKSLFTYGKNKSTFNINKIDYYDFFKKYDLNSYFLNKINKNHFNKICYDQSF